MSGTEVSKQGPAQTSVQGKLVRQTAIAAPSPDDFEKQAAAAKAAADAAAADAADADAHSQVFFMTHPTFWRKERKK